MNDKNERIPMYVDRSIRLTLSEAGAVCTDELRDTMFRLIKKCADDVPMHTVNAMALVRRAGAGHDVFDYFENLALEYCREHGMLQYSDDARLDRKYFDPVYFADARSAWPA